MNKIIWPVFLFVGVVVLLASGDVAADGPVQIPFPEGRSVLAVAVDAAGRATLVVEGDAGVEVHGYSVTGALRWTSPLPFEPDHLEVRDSTTLVVRKGSDGFKEVWILDGKGSAWIPPGQPVLVHPSEDGGRLLVHARTEAGDRALVVTT